jgi:hypothetical protein
MQKRTKENEEKEEERDKVRKVLWRGRYGNMEISIGVYPYGYTLSINDKVYFLGSVDSVLVFLQDELLKREALEKFEYKEGMKLSEVVQWFKEKKEEIRKWTQGIAL